MSQSNPVPARCWAEATSPCGDEDAREQHISAPTFFGAHPTIEVSRTSETRTLCIDDLLTGTLCPRHSRALSDLDQALADLVNSVRETERLRDVRKGATHAWYAPVRFVLDGPRLERCMLKMAMNYSSAFGEHQLGWQPPEWLPNVVLGTRSLGTGAGLGMIARVGDRLKSSDSLRFSLANSERDALPFSALLEIRRELRLICSWERPLTELSDKFYLAGEAYFQEDVIARPRRMSFDDAGRSLGISLDFDWTGRWSEKKFPTVAALRKKFRDLAH
jgi:hypothetical protein